jgi:uncharacterized membrane protein
MMSQNRQSSKDRLAAEVDHQVNAKAELEINNLMRHIEELESRIEERHVELKKLIGGDGRKKRVVAKAKRKTSK